MLTPQDIRLLALSLPEVQERDHFGFPSFRVKRIFLTMFPESGWVHLMLTPEIQQELIRDDPQMFAKVPNKWGDNGATRVILASAEPEKFMTALQLAWRRAAPAKIVAAFDAMS